jgi:tetratricopeptide (TPR) repeat protein
MKTFIILSLVTAALVAGAIIYLNNLKAAAPPAPAVEAAPSQPGPQPEQIVSVPKPLPPSPIAAPTPVSAPVAVVTPAGDPTPSEPTNSIRKTVDALLAARGEKHAMFEQLRQNGQLDAAIAELQRRATENPNDVGIPTTLGEALLNKVRAMHDSGITDRTDLGILALQADQQFNAALKIDSKNWEAQFMKGSTMYYWPADAERDADAVQRLASLIDQQETMPPHPEFVQSYLALGNQYQKMGKLNEAMATWQLGLQKFPGDPALQSKIRGQ